MQRVVNSRSLRSTSCVELEKAEPMKIGAAVGQALRELRHERGQTQQDVANMLAPWGLAWTRAQVAGIEAGRRETFALDELIILSYAYDIKLRDWFPGDGLIALRPGVYLARIEVRIMFSFNELHPLRAAVDYTTTSEAEQNAARALGVTRSELMAAAVELWGTSFTDERDGRLSRQNERMKALPGNKRLAGMRSASSRGLMTELRRYFAERSDDDDEP